ncbi:MAG: hypothetical protein A2516_05460 [Alphaproteobacteria bacterium RIFOXYD12_FULL_60_8]|nr:MAG: hypothetical protein A2516_05460 [Alphaproteobacteria bacterium RIFOXYD12_FULL_60_8]
MKNLFLLRHAKSSWADPATDDFDRPLNKRGIEAATLMRAHLSKVKVRPDLVLCSPARRAKETYDLVAPALKGAEVVFDKKLYIFDYRPVLERIGAVEDKVSTLLVIAHNPALEELTQWLTSADLAKFPTGALACFKVSVKSWKDLAQGGCTLSAFIRPKELG